MNNYDPYICHFDAEISKARKMTAAALQHAIHDCQQCIELNINPGKYFDQLSV